MLGRKDLGDGAVSMGCGALSGLGVYLVAGALGIVLGGTSHALALGGFVAVGALAGALFHLLARRR